MPTFHEPPEAVRAALDRSRRHLESGQREGQAASFAFESLTGLRLDDAVLTDALLQETDFSRSSLVAAQVCSATANGAVFVSADVSRANFKKAALVEASFAGALARDTRFQDCSLTKTVFDRADLRGSDFEHAVLTGASFREADLQQANLTRATIRGADFTAAKLAGVVFDSTVLDNTTRFDGSTGLAEAVIRSVVTDQGTLYDAAAREQIARMISDAS